MRKHNEIPKMKNQFFIDKENEILSSFQKLNEMFENLDSKMKNSMCNQEKSFFVSFTKVMALISKDMKTLKDNYSEALHTFEINPNIVKFKKEIFLLKNQIGNLIDENKLLRKINANYKSNVSNMNDDRNFEKSFVLETQRENKYLKITLDELIEEQDYKKDSKTIKEFEPSFKYQENKTPEENILDLMNEKIKEEEKIDEVKKIFEFVRKQHNSEIITYKNELSILKTKLSSLTKTNNKILTKINGVSKIEKLFNESVEALKEKIFLRKERSKSSCFGQSNILNSLNNSNASKITEIMNGIDVDNFNKIDKIELISSFLSNEKFLSIIKDLAIQKKCCTNADCYFNIETIDRNESPLEITKFSEIIKKMKKIKISQYPVKKNEQIFSHTERSHLLSIEPKKTYLNLTNRDNQSIENRNLSYNEQNKEKEKLIGNIIQKCEKIKNSWDPKCKSITKSDDKLFLYFRKRHFKKNSLNFNQKSQDLSTLLRNQNILYLTKNENYPSGIDISFS